MDRLYRCSFNDVFREISINVVRFNPLGISATI